MTQKMNFKRQRLPVGDEEIPVLVASEGGQPRAVFMSYESFLELAATLYTAIETLRAAGVDPSMLSDEDATDEEAEDPDMQMGVVEDFVRREEWEPRIRGHLRLVSGE